jgi:thiosulfate/3-mercaptopyruvate sulfurtransferase
MSPQTLISPPALAGLRRRESVAILDVRWGLPDGGRRADFEASHIPGAQFVDLDTELASAPGQAGRHPLPSRRQFVTAMRIAGVDKDSTVVLYDAHDATAAARGWWLLKHFGHKDVRVLDGGLKAWLGSGLPVESGNGPTPRTGTFAGSPGSMPVLEVEEVLDFARSSTLLDARGAERYRGENEPIDPVAGHIPGAVSAPTMENVTVDGHFLETAELRERFRALGIAQDAAVAVYCGSGVTAAHQVLALHTAGWSQWVADPTRPVAIGDK